MASKAMWEVDPETRSKVFPVGNLRDVKYSLTIFSSSRSRRQTQMTAAATAVRRHHNGRLPSLVSLSA